VGIARSSARYRTIRSGDEEIRERLRELAGERRRFGYRRLHVMLRREGQMVNHKRVYRLERKACPCERESASGCRGGEAAA
jgi:putative transposase